MKRESVLAARQGGRAVLRALSGGVVLGMLAQPAALAVTTQTFTVGATITPGCEVVTGSGAALGTLNFGTRSGVEKGQVTSAFVPNASLSLGCTPGVALSMSISSGNYYSTVRNMQRSGGVERVPYRLYTSSTLAPNTEIGVNQPVPVTITNSNNISLAIFGAAQLTGFSPAGTYSDQLTVTLSW